MQGINESEENSFELTETRKICQVAFNIVFVLLTVVGNSLVCVTYHQNKAIRKVSNMLVLSMAYCDLLMVLSFVFKISIALCEPDIRRFICISYSCWGFIIASLIILHLCAISIDRLLAVKYSLRYNTIVTRARVRYSLLCIWLFGLFEVALVPLVLNSSTVRAILDKELNPCMGFWSRTVNEHQTLENVSPLFLAFSVCTFACIFVLPILIIVFSYCYIWNQACRHSKKISAHKQAVNERSEKHFQAHIKSTKTFAIVIGVFLLCFLPVVVVMCKRILFFTAIHEQEATLVVVTAHSSAIWNPLIYAWRNRDFRKAVRRKLTIRR